MSRRDIMTLRGGIARGAVASTADDGQAQTVDVETHEGVLRAGVEVMQVFGLASRPPAGDGAMALLLAIGGDQGDMVALPLGCPSVRFGKLANGDSVLYDAAGQRVHLRDGVIVEIVAVTKLRLVAPTVEIVADAVTITGDLAVAGQVSDAAGSMQEMRDRYNSHDHGSVGPPSPLMD